MRIVWTLFKVILGLAIALPVGMFVLALAAGVVGTLFGLTIMALRLALIGLAGYGLFRLARHFFAPAPVVPRMRDLPAADPYYEAAMRELDAEMRHSK